MALIACPECKKKISESASNCPNCGYQITPEIIAETYAKQLQAKKNVRWEREQRCY
jgi:predicted amidophosphoribosyltransferase